MLNTKIYKWNIYNARFPFTTDFSLSKQCPVLVIGFSGDDVIILPISNQVSKKQSTDFNIQLQYPSLIKVGNIQSIHKQDIISPYVDIQNTTKIFKASKNLRKQIKTALNIIIS